MSRSGWLVSGAAVVFLGGCTSAPVFPGSPLGDLVVAEAQRDAPLAPEPGSALDGLRAEQFLFVGGFLNEVIPGYFTDTAYVASSELGAGTELLFPSSLEGLNADVELIREHVQGAFAQTGRRVVLVGHSKGGAGSLLAVIRHPELLLGGAVDRVIVIQGAIGGSPVADSIAGAGPIRLLPSPWGGLESLETARSRELFQAELAKLRAKVSAREVEWISERVFYVRSFETASKVALELALTHEFLSHQGSGQNDGLLLVEDMKLDELGTDLGVLEADHAALTVSGVLSRSTARERRVFARALFRRVFEGPPRESIR